MTYPTRSTRSGAAIWFIIAVLVLALVCAFAIVAMTNSSADASTVPPGPVTQWHPPSLDSDVSCDRANGVQTGSVTAVNDESQTAVVRNDPQHPHQGPIFLVGDTIAAHHPKTESFTKPGTFAGNVTVAFSVNFASDSTLRYTSVVLHFDGGCVPPTTTTTAPPSTTTTSTNPPPCTLHCPPPPPPSTEPPTSLVPPVVQCADDGVVTAAPATCTTPVVTG